jgi:membrane-associated protein
MMRVDIIGTFNNVLSIFDVELLIRYGGLFLTCLVVFATTGLFFCFFLPSGAILFAAGIFAATGELSENIFLICSLLITASVLGNITGYWFGKQAGPSLYRRKDSRFYRRQYLLATAKFYKKYGGIASLVGFFLPIIRTFSPIVAGMTGLSLQRFVIATITGSVLWIVSFVLAGYFIGSQALLRPWLKYIVLVFILVVTIPLIIRIIRELKKNADKDK